MPLRSVCVTVQNWGWWGGGGIWLTALRGTLIKLSVSGMQQSRVVQCQRSCQFVNARRGKQYHFSLPAATECLYRRGCWEINLDLQLPLHLPLLRVGWFPWEHVPGYRQKNRKGKREMCVCVCLFLFFGLDGEGGDVMALFKTPREVLWAYSNHNKNKLKTKGLVAKVWVVNLQHSWMCDGIYNFRSAGLSSQGEEMRQRVAARACEGGGQGALRCIRAPLGSCIRTYLCWKRLLCARVPNSSCLLVSMRSH